MLTDPDWAPIFAPDGYLAQRGDHIERINYAKTLKTIAVEGPDAFYTVISSRILSSEGHSHH